MKYVSVVEFASDPVLVSVKVIESVPLALDEPGSVSLAESILKLPHVIPGKVHDIVIGVAGGGVVMRTPASSIPTTAATIISRMP